MYKKSQIIRDLSLKDIIRLSVDEVVGYSQDKTIYGTHYTEGYHTPTVSSPNSPVSNPPYMSEVDWMSHSQNRDTLDLLNK